MLVWAKCMRQHNEVAIKVGIISPPPLLSLRAFWSMIGWWLQWQASLLAAGSKLILVRAKYKHIPNELWRCQAKVVTTIIIFLEETKKTEKCLELPDLAR